MFQKNFATMSALLLLLGVGCPSSAPEYGTVPVSGEWSFAMTGSSEDLTCPIGGGGFNSVGSADLSVSQSGSTAVLDIDGQTLVFYGQPGPGLSYRTQIRTFPVGGSGTGTVSFEFVANTDDTIVGTLSWDNQSDCTGDYPFTMELLAAATSSNPFALEEGSWGIQIDGTSDDCGGNIAGFAGLPSTANIEYVYDLDTNAPDPSDVMMDPPGLGLQRVGDTNTYAQSGSAIELGAPVDAQGDVLLDFEQETFTGSFEISAGGNGTASGLLYYSSGGCSGTASISMVQ